MLLGWITNNYWETNFRAHQPGRVRARYQLLPHQGGLDEPQAHRFGLEAANTHPLLQHLGEPAATQPLLPAAGSLLHLPGSDSTILTLHVKPADEQPGLIVRLLNASEVEQPAKIGSGLLRIVAAQRCDLLEKPLETLEVQDNIISLILPPRRVTVIDLNVG